MKGAVSFSGAIEVLHSLLKVCALLSEPIILASLELKLLFNVVKSILLHVLLSREVVHLSVLLLHQLFQAVDLYLTHVDFVLVLLDLNLGSLVHFLLGGCHIVQLYTHVFNLLGLSVIDVCLPGQIFMAVFDFSLCRLIFLRHIALCLLGLCKLDFDVAEGVLQLLVFNLAQAQHLPVLDLSSLLTFNSESAAYNSLLLYK